MALFHEMSEVFVRTPWPLTIRYDGQESTLQPGKNSIPTVTIENALNQNPLMGSADAYNPHLSGGQYLIGVIGKEKKYPCDPLTEDEIFAQNNCPSRYDYMALLGEKLVKGETVAVRGRKKASRYEVSEPSSVGTDRND